MSSPPPRGPSPHQLEIPDPDPSTFNKFFPVEGVENETEGAETETDADIRRDISLLSTLLKGHRPGKSTVKESRSSLHSDLWSHIAYALVPGSSADETGNKVVAVVGRMEPGFIAATVVARNPSPLFTNDRRSNPIEIDGVAVRRRDVVREMLEKC